MVSQIYQSDVVVPDKVISAGLMTILDEFTHEWSYTEGVIEKSIQVESLCYHIKKFGDFSVVLVDQSLNENQRMNLVQIIGWKFLRMYGEEDILNWRGHSDKFTEFIETINEILREHNVQASFSTVSPRRKLSTADIFELNQSLQSVAVVILALEKATVSEIAEESNHDIGITENYLDELYSQGFLTKEISDGELYYKSII